MAGTFSLVAAVVDLPDEQCNAFLGERRVHEAALAQGHEREGAHRLGYGLGHRGHHGPRTWWERGGEEHAHEGDELERRAGAQRGSPVRPKAVVVGREPEQRDLSDLAQHEVVT